MKILFLLCENKKLSAGDDKVIFTANTNAKINEEFKPSLDKARNIFKNNLEIVLGGHEVDYKGSPYR